MKPCQNPNPVRRLASRITKLLSPHAAPINLAYNAILYAGIITTTTAATAIIIALTTQLARLSIGRMD